MGKSRSQLPPRGLNAKDKGQPMPSLETLEHLQAGLGHSLAASLLLSPGSWCAQGFVCALQESAFPVLFKFWWL